MVAADGSPVEVYTRLPAEPELGVVRRFIGERGSVLDLGCGVGRIAAPLAAEGHDVVAVDESAAMLVGVRHAQPVQSTIEDLDLGRSFDVVLLLSHLVNAVEAEAFLATAARHLADDGLLLAQRLKPGRPWRPGRARLGEVSVDLVEVAVDGDRVRGATRYGVDSRIWLQRWELWERSDEQLEALLRNSGLRLSGVHGVWAGDG